MTQGHKAAAAAAISVARRGMTGRGEASPQDSTFAMVQPRKRSGQLDRHPHPHPHPQQEQHQQPPLPLPTLPQQWNAVCNLAGGGVSSLPWPEEKTIVVEDGVVSAARSSEHAVLLVPRLLLCAYSYRSYIILCGITYHYLVYYSGVYI